MQWHVQSVCVGQNLLLRISEYTRPFLYFIVFLKTTIQSSGTLRQKDISILIL